MQGQPRVEWCWRSKFEIMEDVTIKTLLRILHVEDNPHDRQLVEEGLAADGLVCEFIHVAERGQFEARLEQNQFDVILSDFTLPSYDGMAALAASQTMRPEIPFIFVSGTIGEERAVDGLKFGATDFVLKGHLYRLGPVIRRALREARERSERKRAEQQVHIQAMALEAAANGIIITDKEGAILWANTAFCNMTGYAIEEVIGQTPRLFKSDRHGPNFYKEMWETVMAGRAWRGEVTNRRKDGTIYDEEMTITPVHANGSRVTHFIAVKQDTTERKHLEEQLRQAQKMEAIGRLAGGIAHDFNNLLTVIHGSAELVLMRAEELTPEVRECLKLITVSSERAANLTSQLLAFGRKQAMKTRPLSLSDVIKNLTKMLNRIIGEDIRLQCMYGPEPPFVEADVGMMEQVLMNLAINARDAMPHGGQLLITTDKIRLDEVYVHSHPEARAGDFVFLTVSDTGSGITPADLPRIFEPFFTTKEPGKGTGLGLATVYGIVKQHNGWINVSSQLDSGTTFEIFLPAIQPTQTPTALRPVKTSVLGGTEKILLVEDDTAVRLLTRRILEAYGYHVWEAASGRQALEVWRSLATRIDLLLTDIVMPDGVSGRELSDQLCAQTPGLKVIFTSGYSRDVAGQDTAFIRRSQAHFLQKPCPSDVLLNTVRRCLDGKTETANSSKPRSTI